jgi:DNA topoisomerase IB
LAIPPAWVDVWICPWPHGHIQAIGTDSAGRRQYRYHDAWRVLRDKQKFERVLEFGRSLPVLRASVAEDLGAEGAGRDRVLAGAVRLLDLGFFRIGGEQYAQEHETFGIATVRKDHVTLADGTVTFDYPAKGSIQRTVTVSDPATFALIRMLRQRRSGGDNLLAYKDGARWRNVKSDEVNAYIREAAGGEFSAKDFRTWSATVLAAVELATSAAPTVLSKSARKKASRQAVAIVAEHLGNTPAVCRTSYIDPKIFDRFDHGLTVANVLTRLDASVGDLDARAAIEAAVIDLITDDHREGRADAA